jgi:hypothetical protein
LHHETGQKDTKQAKEAYATLNPCQYVDKQILYQMKHFATLFKKKRLTDDFFMSEERKQKKQRSKIKHR